MKNRILLIVVFCLLLILINISSDESPTFFKEKKEILVKDVETKKIKKIDLENYVIGVVAGEMPASFEIEALKAQAIAARSYAVYKIQNSNKDYDVVTDVSNQKYISIDEMKNKWKDDFDKYYNKIKSAVLETKEKVMFYNGKVIEAYYFAMSNGYTEKASLVFSEDRDYLQSVESSYDNETIKNFEVTKEFLLKNFCDLLNIENSNININEISRSKTNRIDYIIINNIKYKGTDVRKKLNLRSTDFDINIIDNIVKVTTRGYGHGVGMSQYGANGMAKDGYKYEEILKYYYKNVKISSI